jgi:hypothetical protein
LDVLRHELGLKATRHGPQRHTHRH